MFNVVFYNIFLMKNVLIYKIYLKFIDWFFYFIKYHMIF